MAGSILDQNLKGVNNLSFNPVDLGMAPLPLNVLVPGTEIPADLFLAGFSRERNKVEMVPAAAKGDLFQEEWRDNLIKAGQEKVYVSLAETQILTRYFNEYTKKVVDDPRTTRKEKSAFIHEMAGFNLRLLFSSELSQGAMDKAVVATADAVDMMLRDNQILTRISDLLKIDYSLYSHSVNVSMLALSFGRFLQLTPGQIRSLGLGGMLMEVGLAKIEPQIWNKPEHFNPKEKAIIHRHAKYGYDLLKTISAVPFDVLTIVLYHHENYDGTGYPDGKTGEAIPYLARIIRVLDTYDALTSPRPHRPALEPMEAGRRLQENAGTTYDRKVVTDFLRFMGSPLFRS